MSYLSSTQTQGRVPIPPQSRRQKTSFIPGRKNGRSMAKSTVSWRPPEADLALEDSELSAPRFKARATGTADPPRVHTYHSPSNQPLVHYMPYPPQRSGNTAVGYSTQTGRPNSVNNSHQELQPIFWPPTLYANEYAAQQPLPSMSHAYGANGAPYSQPDSSMMYGSGRHYSSPYPHTQTLGYFQGNEYTQWHRDLVTANQLSITNSLTAQPQMPPPYQTEQNFGPTSIAGSTEQHYASRVYNPGPMRIRRYQNSNFFPGRTDRHDVRVSHMSDHQPESSLTTASAMHQRYGLVELDVRSEEEHCVAPMPRPSRSSYFLPPARSSPLSSYQSPSTQTSRQVQEFRSTLRRLLPTQLSRQASTMCDICAKDYSTVYVYPDEEEEVAIELPCGHCFGEWCIFNWFDTCEKHKNKVTCPMCRILLVDSPRCDQASMLRERTLLRLARHPGVQRQLYAAEDRYADQEHSWREQRRARASTPEFYSDD